MMRVLDHLCEAIALLEPLQLLKTPQCRCAPISANHLPCVACIIDATKPPTDDSLIISQW